MAKVKVLAKHCRRLGENLTGQEKFRRILAKRNFPPGIHGQRGFRRVSEYGLQLKEKQKLRFTYGLRDKQLRKYYEKALHKEQNTGEELISQIERRLDNVVFRLGMAMTRAQARQMVNHRHVLVNSRIVNIPSYQVQVGDKIVLKGKSHSVPAFKENMARKNELPNWLDFDVKDKQGTVINNPEAEDLNIGINTRLIIEFYSR